METKYPRIELEGKTFDVRHRWCWYGATDKAGWETDKEILKEWTVLEPNHGGKGFECTNCNGRVEIVAKTEAYCHCGHDSKKMKWSGIFSCPECKFKVELF